MLEVCENYIKQTWRNRCIIATANGPMVLSIPVENGSQKTNIRDVRISEHGNWKHIHWNSIEAAYKSSPFFEYYSDDLKPLFDKKVTFLVDFNEGIREKLCELLEIDAQIEYTTQYSKIAPNEAQNFRDLIHPKKEPEQFDPLFSAKTYYQVFEEKLGFQPNMSILDLLFNMGPESILYL